MSPRSTTRVAALLGLVACGGTTPTTPTADTAACPDPLPTYETFGEAFMGKWCGGCHSAALPEGQRNGAPLDMNFDTEEDVRERADLVIRQATEFPFADSPSDAELRQLNAWLLGCQ